MTEARSLVEIWAMPAICVDLWLISLAWSAVSVCSNYMVIVSISGSFLTASKAARRRAPTRDSVSSRCLCWVAEFLILHWEAIFHHLKPSSLIRQIVQVQPALFNSEKSLCWSLHFSTPIWSMRRVSFGACTTQLQSEASKNSLCWSLHYSTPIWSIQKESLGEWTVQL
jgi:hypothetical protein